MSMSFQELLEIFVVGTRAHEGATAFFRDKRHDRDLVPGLDRRLARIGESYGRFSVISCETQGINDNGSDVTVRCRTGSGTSAETVQVYGFQIKAQDELTDARVVSTIKAQRDDALRKIPGLTHYYVLLCGDEQLLKKRFNAIRAEFVAADRTTIVSPVYLVRLYRCTNFDIDATVKRAMEESDIVLRTMERSFIGMTDTAKAVVSYMVGKLLLTGEARCDLRDFETGPVAAMYRAAVSDADVIANDVQAAQEREAAYIDLGDEVDEVDWEAEDDIVARLPLDVRSALAADLDLLEGDMVFQEREGDRVKLNVVAAAAITAIAADAVVRYEYSINDLVPYLLALAGVSTSAIEV